MEFIFPFFTILFKVVIIQQSLGGDLSSEQLKKGASPVAGRMRENQETFRWGFSSE